MNSIKAWVKCNIIQEPSLSILLRLNCSVHGTPRRHYLNPLGLLVCLEFVYVTVSTNKYWAVKGSCQVIASLYAQIDLGDQQGPWVLWNLRLLWGFVWRDHWEGKLDGAMSSLMNVIETPYWLVLLPKLINKLKL